MATKRVWSLSQDAHDQSLARVRDALDMKIARLDEPLRAWSAICCYADWRGSPGADFQDTH